MLPKYKNLKVQKSKKKKQEIKETFIFLKRDLGCFILRPDCYQATNTCQESTVHLSARAFSKLPYVMQVGKVYRGNFSTLIP